jgi:hypothetical protein
MNNLAQAKATFINSISAFIDTANTEEHRAAIASSIKEYLSEIAGHGQLSQNQPSEVDCFSYVSYSINRKNKVELRRPDGKIEIMKKRFRSRRVAHLAAKYHIKNMIHVDLVIRPIMPLTEITITLNGGSDETNRAITAEILATINEQDTE